MGWRSSEIEVYHTIDLSDYDDEIMEYMEPDNINDAMELMEQWGYSDGDIIEYMLEEPSSFLEKVSNVLTVETALTLVKDVYEYGHAIQVRNLTAKENQIKELKQRIDDLLALNHTVITEKEETTHES
jgi:nitrogen regulatory protein PII-like uncharacterized protein